MSPTPASVKNGKPVLVLDGGFSNELNKYCSFDVHREPLWTAKALIDEQNAIVQTHLAYLNAGADIIETSTFQATVPGFKLYNNLSGDDSEKLMKESVILAKRAVDEFKKSGDPLVGGSIGPYGAFLRDGSEYNGNYMDKVTEEQLTEVHLPRIRALAEAGADLLVVETIPALMEAEHVLKLIKQYYPNSNVWICFSVKEGDCSKTPRGEMFIDVFNTVKNYTQVKGFGINCCQPQDVTGFLQEASVTQDKILTYTNGSRNIDLVVYPNSGDDWVRGQGWIKKDIPSIDSYASLWASLGANVIGGCCQIGPDGIRKLRTEVDQWNSSLENLG